MIKLVRSQGKRPIDTGFTDENYNNSFAGVREWLKSGTDATLSMVVPDGVIVLDVDVEPAKSQIQEMNLTQCYQITRNGRHYAFKTDKDYAASTKVITRLGVTVTYRVGRKNCIMIYDKEFKRRKVGWGAMIHTDRLPEFPELMMPLDTRDQRQIVEAVARQLSWAYKDSRVGGDALDMSFAALLLTEVFGMTETYFKSIYEIVFEDRYDEKRTTISYERAAAKIRMGERVQGVGTFVDILKTSQLDHIVALVNMLSHEKDRLETIDAAKSDKIDNVDHIARELSVQMREFPHVDRWYTIEFLREKCLKIRVDWELVAKGNGVKKLTREHYRIVFIDAIKRLIEDSGLGIIFDEAFYVYNGKYWKPIDATDFQCLLRDSVRASGAPILIVGDQDFLKKLYEQAKQEFNGNLKRETSQYTIINLNNTAIKISAGSIDLVKHDKSHGMTYCLPYDYNPEAQCPEFKEKYLDKSLPSKIFQQMIQEFIGYVFIPTYQLKLERVLVLYGGGHNGKSVMYDIIRAMLGTENISGCTIKDLMQEHYRAMLDHKLLNYASESPQGVDNDIFQSLASGEPITVRQKYGKPYEMTDYAKIAFNCNELPQKSSGKDAFYRRFMIIPFTVTITSKDRDASLATRIIRNEMSGVFNWALEGLVRVLKNKGFNNEKEMVKQLKQYQDESDTVMAWIKYVNPSQQVEQHTIYKEYSRYTLESGHKPVAFGKFKDRLVGAGYSLPTENGRHFIDFNNKPRSEEDIKGGEWYDLDAVVTVNDKIVDNDN